MTALLRRCTVPCANAPAAVSSKFVAVLLGGVLWMGAGCWRQTESDSPKSSSTQAATADVSDRETRPKESGSERSDRTGGKSVQGGALGSLVEEDSQDVDDPSRDGWTSEVLSGAAKQQLKKLAKLGTKPQALKEDGLTPLVADDFQGSPLCPPSLEVVYEQTSIRVLRPQDPEAGSRTAQRVEGRSALVKELISLYTFGGKTEQARVEFKTYRVAGESGGFVTRELVSVFATGPGGSNQQTADWTCRWTNENPPRLREITVEDYEAVQFRSPAGALLSDCTRAVLGRNESFQKQLWPGSNHWVGRIQNDLGISLNHYRGLAVGDANGDGRDDLFVCQPGGLANRLFIQNADGTATDVSADAGVDWLDDTHSALLLDLDNDGDQDLIVGVFGGIVFLENQGPCRFRPRAVIPTPDHIFSLAAADYDGDSRLDVYVCCHRASSSRDIGIVVPLPIYDATNGARNLLVRNKGHWQFEDVTRRVGLETGNDRWTLAAAWEDYDNDGDLDLYVANDFGRNNLYRNDDGHFEDVTRGANVEDFAFGMSAGWGDFNNDGLMDLYVSNMFSSAGERVTRQEKFPPGTSDALKRRVRHLARGNTLYQNLGNGRFRDVSVEMGVTMGRWAWANHFADLNNDGWDDLVVSNGYVTNELADDL